MASHALSVPQDYWNSLSISKADKEFIHTHLFEVETPLTEKELVPALVGERIRVERQALLAQKDGGGRTFLPKEHYKAGETIFLPALDWVSGKITSVRPGLNPEAGEFEVIEVDLGGAKRYFAAGLAEHALNDPIEAINEDASLNLEAVLADHGPHLEKLLAESLGKDENLVRIAGRWFPSALLVDVNLGHLNLAEAVLDEAGGKPLPASALVEQVELTGKVNAKLVEFSMNYALQEDGRFDEVGPAGEVLWCLRRLEPEDVQSIPASLRYNQIEHDRNHLTPDMLALETLLDDELSQRLPDRGAVDQAEICLTYPHWRAGTLPVGSRVRGLFPTAYESPRVRFSLVDGMTDEELPAWVVREYGYVSGLLDWYRRNNLIPGSQIVVCKGKQPGKVVIQARSRRTTRDWVRTVLAGSDGGLVFAMLRQNISADYDERMVIAIPDPAAIDEACTQLAKSRQAFEQVVAGTMQELTKLNLQGHVHAQELYSALNITRRCPPAPLLCLLAIGAQFTHVGDLHYRLEEHN
ncbi:MAG: hypothetical protein FJZ96_05470 [Chloroflexi bacterium]|nr:hypothetical protein [Chloroflexota bacterium]